MNKQWNEFFNNLSNEKKEVNKKEYLEKQNLELIDRLKGNGNSQDYRLYYRNLKALQQIN